MGPQLHGSHVKLTEVRKSFGSHNVLQQINLEIKPGDFIAIVGRSGCGKSTLLRLLAGLDQLTEGTLLVNGKTLSGIDHTVRMMFQEGRLLPWKRVLDNIGLGLPKGWRKKAEQALGHVGLLDRADEWPTVLSGGQQQRVALARALVNEPRLLLLDEPLSALDALTRLEMQGLIERLWLQHQFTAVFVTHDVEEAVALANRVILIEEGKVTMDYPIQLPRPRQRSHAVFASITGKIRERIIGADENARNTGAAVNSQ
ncbi:ATP-binding cassette domain-containing protein [Aneurinibacillus sp. Ricciae_BoGa-3]|uniref:ATP-binding cassette domain-containing protein n=1 Tax=Aneurinibacillus sp. Ricciae_BoGa-3 TaxID=3022697 RepID=UPI00233FA6FC|nr:ATP-binding cassette domain-containing protein [Aneurinibacillus sp. Ricciae_BoGa-3]WCK54064.1 ATP-binding cassette domain-containing protein [Aneurinibacillus sp. Ricciae_BoGa-3]